MQKTVKVSINGVLFTVSTDEHQEIIESAALLVDGMLKEKIEKHAGLSSDRAALVVALQLASDITRQKQLIQQYEEKVMQLNAFLMEQELMP